MCDACRNEYAQILAKLNEHEERIVEREIAHRVEKIEESAERKIQEARDEKLGKLKDATAIVGKMIETWADCEITQVTTLEEVGVIIKAHEKMGKHFDELIALLDIETDE